MIRRFLKMVLFCFTVSSGVYSQQMLPGIPVIQHFTPDMYNAKADNYCFVQDRRGFMYVANGAGVLEFDGVRWRLISMANRSAAKWLTLDEDGTIYVCGQGEFGKLQADSTGTLIYKTLMSQKTHPELNIQDFWEAAATSDGVFFRSYRHLVRYKNDQIKVWTVEGNGFDLIAAVRDTLYTRIKDFSLVRIVGDSLIPVPGGTYFEKIKINAFLPFENGGILIASRYDGLYLYDGKKTEPFKTTADAYFKKYLIYDARRTTDGHYVFATLQGGVVFMDRHLNVTMILDESNGLPANGVNSVYIDRDETVWLGHGFHGMSRVENLSPLLLLGPSMGLKGRITRMVRHRGSLYVMTNRGIYKLIELGEQFRFEMLHSSAPFYFDMTIVSGDLFAATGSGILKIVDNSARSVSTLYTGAIHAAAWDSTMLFAGMPAGIAIYHHSENGSWSRFPDLPEVKAVVRSFVSGRQGVLWYGTDFEGVGRLRFSQGRFVQDTLEKFGTENGLPEGQIIVWSTGNEPIFLAYNGFYSFDDKNRNFVKLSDSLTEVYKSKSEFWISLNPGRWAVNPMTKNMMLEKPGIYRIWGLSKIKEYVYWRDADRTEWYGGDYLLVRHSGSGEMRIPALPAAYIRLATFGPSVLFGGERTTRTGELITLPESSDLIRIEYTSPIFELSPEFQFRLGGFDEKWSDWSRTASKEYIHLPAGSYRFEMRARDIYGRVTEPDIFEFVIAPHWYLSTWAMLLYALIAVAAIYLLVRFRVHWLKRKNRELEETVAQRTAELRNKELQLVQSEKMAAVGQMVAGVMHEINNPLTLIIPNLEYIQTRLDAFIKKVSRSAPPLNSDLGIEEFQRDLGAAFNSTVVGSQRIRDVVINLKNLTGQGFNTVMDTQIGLHLAGIIELFFRQHNDVSFISDFNDSTAVRIHILEFNQCIMGILNNAVQAIQDAESVQLIEKQKGCIYVSTEDTADKSVRITIRDNGIGIDPKVMSHIFEPFFTTRIVGMGKGLGLSEAYAVIRKLKGDIEVKSEFHKGTSVVIILPAAESSQR